MDICQDSRRSRKACFLLLIVAFSTGVISVIWAVPTEPRTVMAIRLAEDERIRLDGRLEEPVWQRATPATGFLQQDPNEGEPATEETEVYAVYNSDHLYLGVMLFDSDIDGILAYQKEWDAPLYTDDRFMWIFDTFLDGRTGYYFEINPAGLMGDGLLGPGYRFGVNKSWDGIWEARVAMRPDGWSAEIRIPFRTLNFDPSRDTWGINFQRTIRRKQEDVLWSGYGRNQGLALPVHAGRLVGIRDVSQGMGLEAKPYALSGWSRMWEEANSSHFPTDIGLDFSYSITPGLRAAVTVNTDFAEVEVDERRVNLTRFPLYFPEQRDFFLEGSSVFTFGAKRSADFGRQQGEDVTPYFSRRIGLVEEQPIPINYGARLGGQAGRYEMGFLQVRTGEGKSVPAEDFTIARVKRALFKQSYLGAMYTRRATEAAQGDSVVFVGQTFGVDMDLFTSSFRGDKNLEFQTFLVWHTDSLTGGQSSFRDLSAHGITFNYPNDIWGGQLSYRQFGNEFSPAVGFTRRNGFRQLQPEFTFAPRPENDALIRQFRFQVEFDYLMDLSNRLETQETELTLLGIRFQSGDYISFRVTDVFEYLDEEFEIHPDIFVPAGNYRYLNWGLWGRASGHRMVSGNIQVSSGGFWSGKRNRYEVGVTIKPYSGVSLQAEIEKNDVHLREGDFVANLIRLTGQWHISPWVSVLGNLQYDDVDETAGLYTRLRWIIRPGNDLYLVYTHNWQGTGDEPEAFGLSTISQGATTKINYTHRF